MLRSVVLGMLAMLAPQVFAGECKSILENILTSVGCPSSCKYPCVLYAPSKAPCATTQKAGTCQYDEAFTPLVGTTRTPCNVTYQCLDDLETNGKWTLNLDVSVRTDVFTTAPVTQVSLLNISNKATFVQFGGGTFSSPLRQVKMDESLFNVPEWVVGLFFADVDLAGAVTKFPFAKQLKYIALNHANLQEVPAHLANLKQLTTVQLANNKISSFLTDVKDPLLPVFQNVLQLNLSDNALTSFVPMLPAMDNLDLSGNQLGKIPDIVFNMSNLTKLTMNRCGLSNTHVSEAQYAFLDELKTLDADFTTDKCPDGSGSKSFSSGARSICVTGFATTKSSKLPIILGVVGTVVVLLLIVGFVLYRRRRSRKLLPPPGELKPNMPTERNETDWVSYPGSKSFSTSDIWNDPDLQAARVDFRDVEPISLMSRGGFGEVWLGEYMGQKVAIKRLLTDKRKMTDVLAFAAEIKIMARLDHPKIVQFIGVCWTNGQNIQAVTEYMDCGDLRALLDSPKASSLTWPNLKCQIAIDIADALVYMHTLEPKLIHRDLKSRNVLIDANSGAKLSDFGISRTRSMEDQTITVGVGTARWIAPEVILSGHYTESADIYSFGVVLSELDTCKTPYHDATNTNGGRMQDVTILQLVSAGKLQPSFSPTCPRSIATLAQACLSFTPSQRPSAIQITYELRKILKEELQAQG